MLRCSVCAGDGAVCDVSMAIPSINGY